jgi:hypothetical protein
VRPSYGTGPHLLLCAGSRAARGKTTTRRTLKYRNYCEGVTVYTQQAAGRGLETHGLQRVRYCTDRRPLAYEGRWFLYSCSFGANSQTEKYGPAPRNVTPRQPDHNGLSWLSPTAAVRSSAPEQVFCLRSYCSPISSLLCQEKNDKRREDNSATLPARLWVSNHCTVWLRTVGTVALILFRVMPAVDMVYCAIFLPFSRS